MSKTVREAREELRNQGMTIAQWAKEHGFKASAVRSVLCGQNKGNYGEGHRIAVRLGIKGTKR